MFFFLRRMSHYPIVGFIFVFLYRIYNVVYGASIPLSVIVDESTNFPHGIHGIFVSKAATLGKNITIYHQVTIGSNQIIGHKKFGSPSIGDNCLLGVGAKIIGNVKIGNDVYLASNVSISNDINDGTSVMPAFNRLLKR